MNKKYIFLGFVVIFIWIIAVSWKIGRSAEPIPSKSSPTPVTYIFEDDGVKNAVINEYMKTNPRLDNLPEMGIELDNIKISSDNVYATGWIIRTDPETGEVMPSEPGIFIAERDDGDWNIYLPSQPGWETALRVIPNELIPSEEKNRLLSINISISESTGITADNGYLLPWAEGVPVNLSRSVTHDEDIPSGNAHYAFDFYIPQTMFNLYASKAGTVWAFKDTVPNNDHSDVNFIVLRNADNPDLYQLYLHLAQNSIPPSLKTIGAQVIQGQFVGVADNTGASTGHHLHFQVQTLPYWPLDNPYWGKSVDIVFDEVGIYGGRPRRSYEYDEEICGGYCTDGLLTYVSANTLKGDLIPPVGDFIGVTMGQIVTDNILYLSGWANDADSGLYSGQLRALYNGSWHNLGSQFTNTFAYTWDLCSIDNPIPKGVVSVGLRLYDWDGNWADYAGLRHFIKNFDCPQIIEPACKPDANHVALYEDKDFSGGCVVLSAGDYPDAQSIGTLGDNDAASIKVGVNIQATLYSNDNFIGHGETLIVDDNNLSDNLIGLDTLSSLKVGARTDNSGVPNIIYPASGVVFNELDLVPLAWENTNNSLEYQVGYQVNGGASVNLTWQMHPNYYIGSLTPGSYIWRVRSRNVDGVISAWSQSASFTVQQATSSPPALSVPFSDDMEDGEGDWASSGLWTLKNDAESSHSGTRAWWYQENDGDYDSGSPNSGNLTSPPIYIPGEGYYLHFWYRYQTESNRALWDRRWVQISIDGGAFQNLHLLIDDPQISETTSWLQSAAIDLSEFADHTIQFRFNFATLDAELNAFDGWGIDDISVTNTPPPSCSDNRQDETPNDAFELSYSDTMKSPAEICPGGDYDFYKFDGFSGDRVVVDIDAQTVGSPLDSYLVLYDSDGTSILAEHDDEIYAERRDPLLAYTLPHSGVFYVKVRAWKHPDAGGDDYEYTIRLYKDVLDPLSSILMPQSGTYIPVDPFDVTVQAVDVPDGISHVDFFWHNYDWIIPSWEQLGSDWDGSNGWSISFDPSGLLERDGGAFYVDTYDKAGKWVGAGAWNIGVDLTPPQTSLNPAEATQESTAVLLSWNGTDNTSGVNYIDLQYALDGGMWQTYPNEINSSYYWFIGSAGHEYDFRIRGIDHAGNIEDYPSNAETSTSIPSASILCSTPDMYDIGGGDNSFALAHGINPNGGAQIHNFCNPSVPDRLNDEDWLKFNVLSNKRYLVQALPMAENTAMAMELFADDGTTLLAQGTSSTFGRIATIDWNSDRTGEVFLRIRHLDGRVIGNQVLYEVKVQQGYTMFFPLMNK